MAHGSLLFRADYRLKFRRDLGLESERKSWIQSSVAPRATGALIPTALGCPPCPRVLTVVALRPAPDPHPLTIYRSFYLKSYHYLSIYLSIHPPIIHPSIIHPSIHRWFGFI